MMIEMDSDELDRVQQSLLDAFNEIARLRALARYLERDLAAARADNARLREALRGMVNAFAPKAELTVSISGADALQSDVKRALQALGCLMPDAQARATLAQVQS